MLTRNEKHRDEDAWVDLISIDPVLYNQSGRCELVRRYNDILEPRGPTKSKSQSWVAEASCIAGESRG